MEPKQPIKFVARILRAAGRDDKVDPLSLGTFEALDSPLPVSEQIKLLILGCRQKNKVDLDGLVEIKREADGSDFGERQQTAGTYLTNEEAKPFSRSSLT